MTNNPLSEYSKTVGIPEEKIIGRCNIPQVVVAREVYWLYLKSRGYTAYRIAKIFNRSAPAILSGLKTIRNLIDTNDPLVHPHTDYLKTIRPQNTCPHCGNALDKPPPQNFSH